MKHPANKAVMYCILAVVGANYLAQIPYYLYLYYLPHRALPPLFGTTLLAATFVWFLLGWTMLARRGSRAGFWLLLTFLLTEVGFYLYNTLNQVAHGFAPFFHLQNRDPLLFTIFAIGYLNMVGGFVFIIFLVWRCRTLVILISLGNCCSAPSPRGERNQNQRRSGSPPALGEGLGERVSDKGRNAMGMTGQQPR